MTPLSAFIVPFSNLFYGTIIDNSIVSFLWSLPYKNYGGINSHISKIVNIKMQYKKNKSILQILIKL